MNQAYAIAIMVLEMLLTPVLCAVLGDWLDRKLGTRPWFFLAALLLGIASAIRVGFRIYRISMRSMKEGEPQPPVDGPKNQKGHRQ